MSTTKSKIRALQWKNARRTEVVTLPSGNEMEVKRPNLMTMVLESGEVPDFMMAYLDKSFGGAKQNISQSLRQEDLPYLLELMNRAAEACAVSPQLVRGVPDYDADQIALSDLSEDDKLYLFSYAMGGELASPQTAPFPGEPDRGLGTA